MFYYTVVKLSAAVMNTCQEPENWTADVISTGKGNLVQFNYICVYGHIRTSVATFTHSVLNPSNFNYLN